MEELAASMEEVSATVGYVSDNTREAEASVGDMVDQPDDLPSVSSVSENSSRSFMLFPMVLFSMPRLLEIRLLARSL